YNPRGCCSELLSPDGVSGSMYGRRYWECAAPAFPGSLPCSSAAVGKERSSRGSSNTAPRIGGYSAEDLRKTPAASASGCSAQCFWHVPQYHFLPGLPQLHKWNPGTHQCWNRTAP